MGLLSTGVTQDNWVKVGPSVFRGVLERSRNYGLGASSLAVWNFEMVSINYNATPARRCTFLIMLTDQLNTSWWQDNGLGQRWPSKMRIHLISEGKFNAVKLETFPRSVDLKSLTEETKNNYEKDPPFHLISFPLQPRLTSWPRMNCSTTQILQLQQSKLVFFFFFLVW